MALHAQNKGKVGEQEVARMLREIIEAIILSKPELNESQINKLREAVQRNTNQSAAGGCDIMIFGVAIEVKRQEVLSLNKWWTQCLISASRNNHVPILIWRQNRKEWQVKMQTRLPLPETDAFVSADTIVSIDDFKTWFYYHGLNYIEFNKEVII